MSKEKNCVQKTEENQELFSATVFFNWLVYKYKNF